MNEPHWEKKIREKFHFLYPSEHIAADIGKGVVIGVGVVVIGLIGTATLVTWRDSFQENAPQEQFDKEFDDKWDKISANIHAELSAIRKECALYSPFVSEEKDPIKAKLADFTKLYPLSDFLCGKQSNVIKITLINGKNLYFIAPVRMFDCGNGGCTYYPFIEEQPGLVRHLLGFNKYEITTPYYDHTKVFSEDMEGSVFFKMLHAFPETWTISIDDEIGDCITTNTYKIAGDGTPKLIRAYDACSDTVLFEYKNPPKSDKNQLIKPNS